MGALVVMCVMAIIIVSISQGRMDNIARIIAESRTRRLAHLENIERLRCGYPPIGITEKAKDIEVSGIIDMTNNNSGQPDIRQENAN